MFSNFSKQAKAKGAEVPGEMLSKAEGQLEGFQGLKAEINTDLKVILK